MCQENPYKPQYNGGIIVNPDLQNGSQGWSQFANAKVDFREFGGNKFVVARGRNQSYDSVSQKIYLEKGLLYTFSAWLQVSKGKAPVIAVFKKNGEYKHAGSVIAESKCWSMLKGGLTIDESGPAELYFESEDTTVEIWVDSVSLQPFTQEEWNAHHEQTIHKTRKGAMRIRAVNSAGEPVPNATISIVQNRVGFSFGCEVEKNILGNQAYQNWFTKRFTVTTFANEMKWYSTEAVRGKEDYTTADTMLRFFKQHGVAVRGHNIVWNDPKYQLNSSNSMVSLYVDTISYGTTLSTNLVESHFNTPNIPYMRSALDTRAATGLPIWLTEVDVQAPPNVQANYFEQVLREGHAHPQVKGMVTLSGYSPSGCYKMCLTDGNFRNLPRRGRCG
ncbi:hypothetical protein Bca52824_092662 [Brassica carinata]|uniref:GH10 domain-containing protein n=1 Tax=Brassica carinata TaxID=52824 RepID=A0A8X7NUE9_BRACI|nr:hypothetical protein Bca52824_092662 [Brassica carinata]